MSTFISNRIYQILAPMLVALLAFISQPILGTLSQSVTEKLPLLLQVMATISFMLALMYRKHRVAIISAILLMSWIILDSLHHNTSYAVDVKLSLYAFVGVITPLMITAVSFQKDIQVGSVKSLATLALCLTLLFFADTIVTAQQDWVSILLLTKVISGQSFLDNTLVPQLVLMLNLMILGVQVFKLSKNKTIFESSFLIANLMFLLVLDTALQHPQAAYFMLASIVSVILAISINAYSIAYLDELTELPGRRALNEELSKLKSNYAIAMLDVDHFKKFNDTYGHDVGDQVLKMVAAKLKKVTGGGKPYRYGGEEFTVLFPGKTSKETFSHLSQIREIIDETRMILRGKDRPKNKPEENSPAPANRYNWQEVHVTISIGVADSYQQESTDPEKIIKAADKALYNAKERGRNRICQFGLEFKNQGRTDEEKDSSSSPGY